MENKNIYESPNADLIIINNDIIRTSGTEGPVEDGFEGNWDLEL